MKRILVSLLVGFFPAIPLLADSVDLVTIRVKGTNIDLLPEVVNVMVSDPVPAAQQLVAKGGSANKGWPHYVFYKSVLYIFEQPNSWKTQGTHKFKDGDVLYTYHAESDAERKAFAKKYKLKAYDQLAEREGSAPLLYLASPGHYVIILVKQTAYTCSMHPGIIKSVDGKCPLCGMDLVAVGVYR